MTYLNKPKKHRCHVRMSYVSLQEIQPDMKPRLSHFTSRRVFVATEIFFFRVRMRLSFAFTCLLSLWQV